MRSSDEKRQSPSGSGKILRRIGIAAAVIAVLAGMEFAAKLCFDSVHYADYYNYDMRRILDNDARVSLVAAGASQVYHACQPDILAEEFGCDEVIDASTAGQTMDGTYFMVRDMLDRFDPEYVIVGVTWDRFFPRKLSNLHTGRLLVGDRLPFAGRVEYLVRCAPVGQWFNLSALYRYGQNVLSLQQLKENYEAKQRVASGEWVFDKTANSYYGKNGYIVYPHSCEQGSMWAEDLTFDEKQVSEHEKEYCRKIAQLCRERGKKLIWVTFPSTLAEIYSIDNYQFAADYMTQFLESTGFPYLNFSMLKNREEIFPDTMFSDHIHLAENGSAVFSPILADAIRRLDAGEDTKDMFYSSFEEMKKDVHRIVGSYLKITHLTDGTFLVESRSHQNEDIIPQYRLLAWREEAWQPLSDWLDEAPSSLAPGEVEVGESVRLEVRQKGKETAEAFWETTVIEQADAGKEQEVFDEVE